MKNGQTAKLELSAGIHIDSQPATGTNGAIAASFNGSFNCALDPNLKPGAVTGSATFAVAQADGVFANFNTFSTALQCEVTPTDIKQLSVRFQQGGAPRGELAVTGPFDAEKMEGKLAVELHGIDRRLLNLAAEKNGIDFGTTTVNASADIQLARAGGGYFRPLGKFNAAKVQLTRAGQTTPTLDFNVSYDVDRGSHRSNGHAAHLNLRARKTVLPC